MLKPRRLKVIDGREISSGMVDTECELDLHLGDHTETITLKVVDLGSHPIVLGMTWLKTHNPAIDWKEDRITFSSTYCATNCLSKSPIVTANLHPGDDQLNGEYGDPIP